MRGKQPSVISFARKLRREQTSAESLLWTQLRNRQIEGCKFVRQEPIGPYFADFVCRDRKLVIEIDGATHSSDVERRHDGLRTAFLRDAGYHVIRFENDDIYNALDGVVQSIAKALRNTGA